MVDKQVDRAALERLLRGQLKHCPTQKSPFPTKEDAQNWYQLKREANKGWPRQTAYLCNCGWWHLSKRKDGS